MEEKVARPSYKFRIYPTEEQAQVIERNFGSCRWVYNHYLAKRKAAWERTQTELRRPKLAPNADPADERPEFARDENGRVIYEMVPNPDYDPSAKTMSYFDTSKDLIRLKEEVTDENGRAWLKDADSVSLLYSLRNLDDAYQNFFRGIKRGQQVGYPRFKYRKNKVQSYKTSHPKLVGTTPEGEIVQADSIPSPVPDGSPLADVTWHYLRLPKIGDVRAKAHRVPEGSFVSVTVSRTASGKYYASLGVKGAEAPVLSKTTNLARDTFGASR